MAQTVLRSCDYPVKKGRSEAHPCGKEVPDNKPTTFSLNGTVWEADLCAEHQKGLHAAYVEYAQVGHPVVAASRGSGHRQRSKYGSNERKPYKVGQKVFTAADVRQWLSDQGREVPAAGRIAESIIQEFIESQKDEKVSA